MNADPFSPFCKHPAGAECTYRSAMLMPDVPCFSHLTSSQVVDVPSPDLSSANSQEELCVHMKW